MIGLRMLTCEEAEKLISETMDHPLSFWERINLKVHLLICKVCPTYMRQLQLLRELLRKWASHSDRFLPDKKFSPESKEKIKQHLSQLNS